MAKYSYQARKSSGELISGVIEAGNEDEVLKQLTKSGYFVSSIKQEFKSKKLLDLNLNIDIFVNIRKTDLAKFITQLAILLRSGLTITVAMEIVIEQVENKQFKNIVMKITEDIKSGISLSDSFAKYPKIFTPLFVNTVKVGEETGKLEDVLDGLNVFLEKEVDLSEKVRAALSYPIILVIISSMVVGFLVAFVFPRFISVFKKADIVLPLPTQVIYSFSYFLKANWHFLFASIIIFFVSCFFYFRTKNGRYNFDYLKLKIPVFGMLIRKVAISRFASAMEIMVKSGVNLIRALEISKQNIGNIILENVIQDVIQKVKQGGKITGALRDSKEFPNIVIQMIRVGEETDTMEKALANVKDDYDRQVDYAVKRLTTLIEPIMISMMAGIVAFIALALFLPIFDLMKMAKR
jgi:type IV pilus assembly protein PilC